MQSRKALASSECAVKQSSGFSECAVKESSGKVRGCTCVVKLEVSGSKVQANKQANNNTGMQVLELAGKLCVFELGHGLVVAVLLSPC